MAESKIISVIQIDKYNNWMVQEYNGKYSVVDCYKSRKTGDWTASFCQIRDGQYTIPKGLGGQFEDLQDLRASLFRLIRSVDEYDEHAGDPNVPDYDTSEDDIPF